MSPIKGKNDENTNKLAFYLFIQFIDFEQCFK